MKSWKAKAITAVVTLVGLSTAVAADCVGKGSECYNGTYVSGDLSKIAVDVMGAAGVFVNDNITLIGVLLLLGFVMGVVGAAVAKAKNWL